MTHNDLPDVVCNIVESLQPPTGLPIFVGEYPADLDNCITVWLDDGAPTSYFGQSDSLNTALIRIMIRTKSYVQGNDVAERFVQVFKQTFSDGTDEVRLSILGTSQYLGKDTNGRHEFRQNYKSFIKE